MDWLAKGGHSIKGVGPASPLGQQGGWPSTVPPISAACPVTMWGADDWCGDTSLQEVAESGHPTSCPSNESLQMPIKISKVIGSQLPANESVLSIARRNKEPIHVSDNVGRGKRRQEEGSTIGIYLHVCAGLQGCL